MRSKVIFILAVFICCEARAQSVETKTVLTFEQALDKTTTQNPQIKAIGYEHEVAVKEKKAAYGLRLPNVGITGAYTYMSDDIGFDFNNLKQPVSGIVGGIVGAMPPNVAGELGASINKLMQRNWGLVLQDRDFAMAGVSLTMPIYMGGKINAANNAAQIRVEESAEKGIQSKNSLVSELAERYFGLSLAMQVVELRKQVLEGMEKHLSDAKALETNGIIARGERLYAEMHVAEAKKELLKSIRDAQTINSALANTLGEDGSYAPVTTMFIVNDMETLSYFKDMAQQKNTLIKQVSLKESLAKEAVRAERADFMPQLALMGGYDFANYQLSHVVPQWVVGAGVKIKIFDGLSREYKYSAAKSQLKQVQALGDKAIADVSTIVEKVYNEMLTNAEQLQATDASLEFANEYLRIKERAFSEGSATSSDVVDARLNLAKIKTERLSVAYAYDVLLSKLLEICGDSFSYTTYINTKNITSITLK